MQVTVAFALHMLSMHHMYTISSARYRVSKHTGIQRSEQRGRDYVKEDANSPRSEILGPERKRQCAREVKPTGAIMK